MPILLGPILGLKGVTDAAWQVSVLVASDEAAAPALEWSVGNGAPNKNAAGQGTLLLESAGRSVWRQDFSVPRGAADAVVTYQVGTLPKSSFVVPATGTTPRMAYASCNGFSNLRDAKKIEDKNDRWKDLTGQHAARPLHLLLMGGDQVYSDSMWDVVPQLLDWSHKDQAAQIKSRFTAGMETKVSAFYFDLYLKRWSQAEPAAAFASIPSLMMWDDHDILDGWGSYPDELLGCPVYQGIYRIARRHFEVFQRQTAPGTPAAGALGTGENLSFAHSFGSLAIVAPDMRSERTMDRVLTDDSWNAIRAWMDGLAGCRHLLVMSSIPVVHPDFGLLEKILGVFPGRQALEDDLKDHWMSNTHKGERLRLIHRLLNFAADKRCRVTLLSGDVHVGAVGVISSERNLAAPRNACVINQLTSSGIVHPAPPGMALHFLESVGDRVENADRDITTRLLELPGASRRFIGARNWLSLSPDPGGVLWAEWHVEGEPQPYTKAIHPV